MLVDFYVVTSKFIDWVILLNLIFQVIFIFFRSLIFHRRWPSYCMIFIKRLVNFGNLNKIIFILIILKFNLILLILQIIFLIKIYIFINQLPSRIFLLSWLISNMIRNQNLSPFYILLYNFYILLECFIWLQIFLLKWHTC